MKIIIHLVSVSKCERENDENNNTSCWC